MERTGMLMGLVLQEQGKTSLSSPRPQAWSSDEGQRQFPRVKLLPSD